MKRVFLAVVALLVSSSLMAQVQFESGNLKDAIAKANADNKLVMIMGSTTWWGPCKSLEKDVFPTKEAGDFINSKFVFIKYILDKEDGDNINETYHIKGYPTFVFVDGNGQEVARMLGGANNAEGFIAMVTETVNFWKEKNARFKSEPSYAMTYLRVLKKYYMHEKADKIFAEIFAERSIEENFNKESVEYYKEDIQDIKSPIIQYMLDNQKTVAKRM